MTKHLAIYPGTFDPITRGHIDVIERSLNLFDELIVAVAESTVKAPLFAVEERVDMIGEEIKAFERVRVESFSGLLIDYMKNKRCGIILRGLRVISDFEYEFQMALTNRKLDPDVETVFMMTAENHAAISSRFIKQIAKLGGEVDAFVTPGVRRRLKEKSKENDG